MANTHSLDLELSSSQYASIADASQTGLDLNSDFSLECWVKIEQLPSTAGSGFALIAKDDASSQRSWYLRLLNNDKISVGYFDSGGTNRETVSTSAVLGAGDVGVWNHFAATVNITTPTLTIYKNAVSVACTPAGTGGASIKNSTSAMYIGTLGGTGNFMDGLIDDIRVWSDVRTAAEILANYGTQLVGNEANLVGYWKLNNDYLDETSNNNDLTASGSPVFSTTIPFINNVAIFTAEAQDGYIYTGPNQSVYSLARNGSSGTLADTETNLYVANKYVAGGPYYYVTRSYIPFITSSLPDGCTITTANLMLYVFTKGQSDAGQGDIVVTLSTQASITLAGGDFDSLTLNSPAEGATRLAYSGIATDAVNTIALNATGIGWISKTGNTYFALRLSGDVDNSTPTGAATEHRIAANEDTSKLKPRLVVEYTTGSVYTSTLTETVALAEVLLKSESRILSEIVTVVAILLNQASRTFNEIITILDTLLKNPNKFLTEVVTITDIFLREILRTINETVIIVDNIVKSTIRSFLESLTITDLLTKLFNTVLAVPKFISTLLQTRPEGGSNQGDRPDARGLQSNDKPLGV